MCVCVCGYSGHAYSLFGFVQLSFVPHRRKLPPPSALKAWAEDKGVSSVIFFYCGYSGHAYSLFGFVQLSFVPHRRNSLPPLPYKRELKIKEYLQLFQLMLIRQKGEGVFFDVGQRKVSQNQKGYKHVQSTHNKIILGLRKWGRGLFP